MLEYELGNIAVTKSRRAPAQRDAILAAYRFRDALPVTLHPIDPAAVLALADQTNLTFYDASYLWLARSLGIELVTLDRKLQAAI